MTDHSATPSPFDKEPARKVSDQDAASMQQKLVEMEAQYAARLYKPVARVAEVYMSRYTIEWTGAPLPEGAELFALEAGHGDVRDVVVTGWTKADGETLWMEHDGEPMFRAGRHPDSGANRAIYLVPESLSACIAVPEGFDIQRIDRETKPAGRIHGMQVMAPVDGEGFHPACFLDANAHAAAISLIDAAPQPAGEDEKEYEYLQSLADDPLLDGWAPEPHRATKKSTEPAPSAPSPGDALSLHGAAGRSASRAPADVEALAMRMYGKWTDNQGIHCNRFPSWSELSEANRGEWMKKAQQAAKGGAE